MESLYLLWLLGEEIPSPISLQTKRLTPRDLLLLRRDLYFRYLPEGRSGPGSLQRRTLSSMKTEPITQFQEGYRYLSNFWPVTVRLDGVDYPTVEHAYQAAKTFDQDKRVLVSLCRTPGEAKRYGKNLPLRGDWKGAHQTVMLELLEQKFHVSPWKEELMRTHPRELVEGNWWHDNYWGQCYCDRHRTIPGKNMLGRLLMRIRDQLLKEGH